MNSKRKKCAMAKPTPQPLFWHSQLGQRRLPKWRWWFEWHSVSRSGSHGNGSALNVYRREVKTSQLRDGVLLK
jgi:hypothetical protein